MKMNPAVHRHKVAKTPSRLWLFALIVLVASLHFSSALRAQTYPIKNDRILAPEVSHFARIQEPGIDAHGDLSLSIPLVTVPGRDGLNFDIVANYRSGIQVTQSASWIGWGWSLDVGSITRQPLGGLDKSHMTDGNSEHVDWAYSLFGGRKIDSLPDAYMVNLNGNSTALLSLTFETSPTPPLPFTPASTNESGPSFLGQVPVSSPWYFLPSPWRPWKFCYDEDNPVNVYGYETGSSGGLNDRQDFLKLTIVTEDGTRYVFGQPTLSDAFFPEDSSDPPPDTYNRFVSTWRLTAILSPNYPYALTAETPNLNSVGGWVKITYQTFDHVNETPEVVDTIEPNPCCGDPHLFAQITYPYKIETPTHFAIFETKKRYDRDLAFNPDDQPFPQGTRRDYNRLLDKIKLYNTATGQLVQEVSFTYLNNGAISLITDPSAQTRSMLSKLALEKISIKGFQGVASDSLPMYKFSYYDVSKSWWDLNQSTSLMKYQDDFGYYNSDTTGASPNPDTDRPVWSLKEITYPDGGRHFITYKSDSLNSLSVSYGKYIKSSAGHYNPDTTGNFQSLKQGGPRVKSITTYDGYSSNGYVVNFAYGPGRHWSIPEIWFRRNVFPTHLLFSGGERGQSAVTYDWIEKAFPDGSRIKTFYETGDGSPEPQMLYAYPGGGSKFVIIQGNTRWNWGDAKKVQYFAANGVISGNRVREEILNWSYRGQNGDTNPLIKVATVAPSLLYNSGAGSTPEYKLNFTSKRLDSKITKHIVAVATGIDSVTMTETYLYDADGTIMSSRTETSDDGKVRKTEYTYVRELNTVPSFTIDDTMQYRNMRTQMAQASLKDNANLGYSSTATTWRSVNHSGRTKYLPDKEFRWRNSTTAATIPSFNWTAPDTAKWPRAQTFLGYDAHGNLTRIHDAYAGETTVYWDSDATNSLIDSIQTRPNATTTLTTKYGYDPNTFRLTTMTDPNNQTSQYRYDPLQRLIEVINATKRTIANNRYFYSRQGAGSGDNFVTTNPNHVKTTASTHAEHVRNHDFENGSGPLPDSWNKAEIGTGLGTWDSAEKFSGAKSLKAYIPSAGAGNRVRWDAWYDEKISSKKTYRMEVWVKTDAADNGLAAFTLWVHDVNHNYLAAETRKMYLPNTSNVWKKYTLDFTPGISADHVYAIYLDLEPNGAGTIWYDRANFYELNTVKTFAMALAAIFKPCSAKDLARSSPEPSMTSPTGSPK